MKQAKITYGNDAPVSTGVTPTGVSVIIENITLGQAFVVLRRKFGKKITTKGDGWLIAMGSGKAIKYNCKSHYKLPIAFTDAESTAEIICSLHNERLAKIAMRRQGRLF